MTMLADPGTMSTSPDWVPEDYTRSLAQLAGTRSREGRAAILDAMAGQAGQAAALTFGQGTEDSGSDTLAWHETATLLRQLAAAERGLVLTAEDCLDASWSAWADLAEATTAAEHGAAAAAVLATYQRPSAEGDSAGPVRAPAILRLRAAAAACTGAYPGGTSR
ncbi:MAG: hypothetical protein ACRDOL_31885 [Streptosporangiaceae bacterium]